MPKCRTLLALAVAVLVVAPLTAQPPRGQGQGRGQMGGSVMLLQNKDVQTDLKLSDEQMTKVKELGTKAQEEMRGLRDLSQEERREKMQEIGRANEKAVAEILKPEQVKRLKQIGYQAAEKNGGLMMALNNPEVQQALSLSDEQKGKLREMGQEMREMFSGGQPDREKMAEFRKSANEKLSTMLTADQKTKWKELLGEPFKGELGGGQRRPGNPPGN